MCFYTIRVTSPYRRPYKEWVGRWFYEFVLYIVTSEFVKIFLGFLNPNFWSYESLRWFGTRLSGMSSWGVDDSHPYLLSCQWRCYCCWQSLLWTLTGRTKTGSDLWTACTWSLPPLSVFSHWSLENVRTRDFYQGTPPDHMHVWLAALFYYPSPQKNQAVPRSLGVSKQLSRTTFLFHFLMCTTRESFSFNRNRFPLQCNGCLQIATTLSHLLF